MGICGPALETVAVTSTIAFGGAYEGVKVLVTGHTGFKGSWLATWLHVLGAEVSGLALEPEGGDHSLFVRSGSAGRTDSVIGDVRDPDKVNDVVTRTAPDIVFHLAAQPLVRRSYDEPVRTFATNVMGTVNLLDSFRRAAGLRGVVIVTSDKAYENPESGVPIPEESPMGGRDPYSASKGATELATAAYRTSFFSSDGTALIASVRAGNVIGAGDESDDRLVPDIMRALRAREPVAIRNPKSTRPWQHVLEPLRGYLMLGARLLEGESEFASGWNFGPDTGDAITVAELARRIIAQWGGGVLQVDSDASAPHEAELLSLDITKARRMLGFDPIMSIDTALSYTVAGYRDLDTGTRSASKVLPDQIAAYEALAW